jgi:type IV secretion system protein TrbL
MNDLGVIDHFLSVFSTYIDSGFGLLRPEVSFLTATLVVIDVTLAGLFWAMGGTDDVLARLVKKVLYIGAFAFIITNFNALSSILFRSFAGLGLLASGTALSASQLLQPGRLAGVGVDAAQPILSQISDLVGFPEVFLHLHMVVVLLLAWLAVIVSFFVLAVQLFVTLIEFKLTTLAGFVLVPFAMWNRTAFLAERVLGNVVSAGVKVLVLAVIVGIGSGIFGELKAPIGSDPSINVALAMALASLALLGLGIFGPGIATGLVSGAPQLGVGAAAGTVLGVAGLAVAGRAAVAGGARIVGRGATALGAGAASRTTSTAQVGGASAANATTGAANSMAASSTAGAASATAGEAVAPADPPAWAARLHHRQQLAHGAATAAHALRSADHGGSGAAPQLGQEEGRS